MKLLKCSVRNFGTLNEFEQEFEQGLTVIKEENGFGKSTLAAFLKTMFYGLPKRAGRSVDTNERMKFDPWQGGVFGGRLDFEHNGKKYRVERTFGKRENQDTFKLFDLDSMTESTDFSSELGVELFGIDAQSFERSVYVPQVEMGTEMSNDIRTKLSGLIESSDDLGNFESAAKVLEARAKYYSYQNGKKGEIANLQNEIEQLEKKLKDADMAFAELERVKNELTELSAEAEELEVRKEQLRKQITVASDAAALQEQANKRRELEASFKEIKLALEGILARYCNEFASADEIKNAEEKWESLKTAKVTLATLQADNGDRAELEELKRFFGEDVPSAQKVGEIKASIAKLAGLKARAEAMSVHITEPVAVPKAKGTLPKLLIVTAVLLMALGGAALVWQTVVGIVLMVLGVVTLGITGFIYLKNMIASGPSAVDNSAMVDEYNTLTAEIEQLSAEIDAFLSAFPSEGTVEASIEKIAQSVRDLERVEQTVSRCDDNIKEKREEISELFADLDAFFKWYAPELVGEYPDRFVQMRKDGDERLRLSAELEKVKTKLAETPEVKELPKTDELPNRDELLKSEEELLSSVDAVGQKKVELKSVQDNLFAQLQLRTEDEEKLESLKEQYAEATERFKVLSLTLEFLKKAKEDLSRRYLEKVVNGFKKYLEILGVDAKDCFVDTELGVRLDREGSARERNCFSRGVKDMLDIAMRLSLSDALFGETGVALILDDPFVNLDDERLKNAMELLKKLGEKRQIVYLTCHSSRC